MGFFDESKAIVIETREKRKLQVFPFLTVSEKEPLLASFHPDYKDSACRFLRCGPNAGQRAPHEVADLLEGDSPVSGASLSASGGLRPEVTVDVLIIGGGGAGATAALEAKGQGADVLLVTKLRLGDANTVMAEGGVQVAVGDNDSPITHFKDSMKGGHLKNDPLLLKTLVEEGPAAIRWLMEQGVVFDRDEQGNLRVRTGGGASVPRLLACRDYTGLDIMRTLKDCLLNEGIKVMEFSPAVELLSDSDGRCTGAVLKNVDTGQLRVIQAKTVILATGGIGRLHIQGFPTSNHFGATGDALPLAYRMGATLIHIDSFQYHPTGAIYPEPMAGLLVTEAVRVAGAHLVNTRGERFINELDARDVVASAVIRECQEGRGVKIPPFEKGRMGVWLDIPIIDLLHGEGTVEKRFPNMIKQFTRYGIDIRKDPVLIYPTLHYQNGGVKIDVNGESTVKNLFVAGEASGGVHGRNRLMGNSLLEIIVFGKRAGRTAAERARTISHGQLTVRHLERHREDMKRKKIVPGKVSPALFPDYVRREGTPP